MKLTSIVLAGAGILAAAGAAQADDIASLKQQIVALNARISQIETAPSVPAGYQLLSISETDAILVPGIDDKGEYAPRATTIGVLPTADVPASTNVQWSGYVRAAIAYRETDFDSSTTADTDTLDVLAKAGLKVVGTTDTAVGEVGVEFKLISDWVFGGHNSNNSLVSDGYLGWWKVTPELTLSGGVASSLAAGSEGFDAREGINLFSDGAKGFNHNGKDPAQIRLAYKADALSFAIAVEDRDNGAFSDSSKSALGYAGEVKWKGDGFGFDLNAGHWGAANPAADNNWTINVGMFAELGDMATLSVAAGMGEDAFAAGKSDEYSKVSGWLGLTLSDSVKAQLGATHKWIKGNGDITSVGAGLYYEPVKQLTLGLEAIYTDTKGTSETLGAGIVTVYRF